jgi:putative transposase
VRTAGGISNLRVIQTLKVELLWTRDFETIDELRAAVAEWMRVYNDARPHQALGWQTPAERRKDNIAAARAAAARSTAGRILHTAKCLDGGGTGHPAAGRPLGRSPRRLGRGRTSWPPIHPIFRL